MADTFPATAADITDDFVIGKCEYFTSVHLWPLRKEINPKLWLENFLDDEKRHARYLLNAFIYLEDHIVEQIVVDSFEGLSRAIGPPLDDLEGFLPRWQAFVDAVHVVVVRGETANPTDSGYSFARIARDLIGLSEEHIVEASHALEILSAEPETPILFLDDFVGSGNQFTDTWHAEWGVGSGSASFRSLAAKGAGHYFYCPVVATTYGVDNIRRDCPGVQIHPGHVLPPRYSALNERSLVWPDVLRATARDFLREASRRAGIPDTGGGENDWRGFHELALAIGFGHGVPDATLPLFWWESETWNPLKKRPHKN